MGFAVEIDIVCFLLTLDETDLLEALLDAMQCSAVRSTLHQYALSMQISLGKGVAVRFRNNSGRRRGIVTVRSISRV